MSPRPSAREKMLDTFEALVVDEGERAATFDAVAAAAGVSKGGLLYHFPTRDALVEALTDRLSRLVDEDVDTMTSAPEGVVAYFIRTSSPTAISADDPLDRCVTAVSNLAASGRHPATLDALTAMQGRWHQVVLDEVGDPAVARVVSLVSDGLYFTPRPFSPTDSQGDPRRDASIDDVISVLQRLVRQR